MAGRTRVCQEWGMWLWGNSIPGRRNSMCKGTVMREQG